ncbi:MAG: flagellar basal body P-ring formation protein FlgA [Xanthobacteraceae bacterium]|nr:flagellar basal body P-ring formation protein FlgA [Xanthobacteraceae bacterium]MBX3548248.1 flagellar basal body P-ring formation protein FlgA [Xanthobacteraceae bacterium]MCW5679177.1 flagellar basal body P-ring formation protein FlgA [Xanthobacteraceae bacterium]
MRHLKGILLLACAAIVVIWAFSARAQSATPALKAEVTVTGDLVRIGDILENAGAKASLPVFKAPALGGSGTIQVHRVMEALRANGIVVFDTRNLTEVLVSRASRSVTLSDLGRAVAEAAAKRYEIANASDLSVTFDPHMKPLQVELTAKDAPRVVSVAVDQNNNRFEAIIDMPGSLTLRRNPVRMTGTLIETAEVVTLARPISRGETIRESDIILERLPRGQVQTDALTRAELVINQAARRALRSGQTLRAADLMKPQIIARDDAVTIVFRSGAITLTLRGKAMGNGAEGETITVLNPQSKRLVQATVTAPGVVMVSDANPVTTAAINVSER